LLRVKGLAGSMIRVPFDESSGDPPWVLFDEEIRGHVRHVTVVINGGDRWRRQGLHVYPCLSNELPKVQPVADAFKDRHGCVRNIGVLVCI
jgi:hypothetical protein